MGVWGVGGDGVELPRSGPGDSFILPQHLSLVV